MPKEDLKKRISQSLCDSSIFALILLTICLVILSTNVQFYLWIAALIAIFILFHNALFMADIELDLKGYNRTEIELVLVDFISESRTGFSGNRVTGNACFSSPRLNLKSC